MARRCEYCSKGTVTGNSISHAHNVTRRTWKPNLQKVRALVDGSVKRILVCTRCLRDGKVTKPPVRQWSPDSDGATPQA